MTVIAGRKNVIRHRQNGFSAVANIPDSMSRHIILTLYILLSASVCVAQTDSTDVIGNRQIGEVTVTARRVGTVKSRGLMNATTVTGDELFRAACCNLGESFTTNPSVDVSYADAATGARQIRLLGLAGTYVQMMAENIPDYRGAAANYALGYIAGPWMESIQISKGTANVKSGYEGMTGQINVTFKFPEADELTDLNIYGNTMGKMDINAGRNIHLDRNGRAAANLLLHFEENFSSHDGNDDGFIDEARVRQFNIRNAWVYKSSSYIMHTYLNALWEKRRGGQSEHGMNMDADGMNRWTSTIETARYNIATKNAFILDSDHNTNIALILSATMHRTDAVYGMKSYGVNQKNVYASLMMETEFTSVHSLSAGASFNHDYYGQGLRLPQITDSSEWTGTVSSANIGSERENTAGLYAQYTLNIDDKIVAMAGIRADHSNVYGSFVTPRMHIKWSPTGIITVRASIGKGYRTAHAMAENSHLLASGRQLVVGDLAQEEAWNYGLSTSLYIPLFGKTLNVNAEYYYTDFESQVVADYDADPQVINIHSVDGESYSRAWQIDLSYPLTDGLTLTAAYRRTDVYAVYDGRNMEKPLTNKWKGLLTASFKTPLGLWQIDATLQLNGPGRLPTPATAADGTPMWASGYHSFEQLSAQVTRWFRHFSIYIGGENLTGVKQHNPIINAASPWSTAFEPTLTWGPVKGAMAYAGIRIKI